MRPRCDARSSARCTTNASGRAIPARALSKTYDIAVVGCGFTGTSALFQLVDRFPNCTITVFEASGDFGPGYAYRTDECPDYLLNNTAATMCLTPASRRAFADWLASHSDEPGDAIDTSHPPRRLFGQFLKETLSAVQLTAAVKGIPIRLIPEEVTDASFCKDGQVKLRWTGDAATFDYVILATGHNPLLNNIPRPGPTAKARYLHSQVMNPALDDLAIDANVHVLGSSLSAYDVVNRLFSPATGCSFERNDNGDLLFCAGPNRRHVTLCSRSGRLKATQSNHPASIQRRHFTKDALKGSTTAGGLALRDIKQLVDDEAKAHGAEPDWAQLSNPYADCVGVEAVTQRAAEHLSTAIAASNQEGPANFLVDLCMDAGQDIWDSFARGCLTVGAETDFRKSMESAVLAYAAPCPVLTAEKLIALINAGRLTLIKGVSEVRLAEDSDSYHIVHEFGEERARVLINATGAMLRDLDTDGQSDLTKRMRSQGLLQPHARNGKPLTGAEVDMETFRLPNAPSIYLANMLLWGPGIFTSSAALMANVVERIVDDLLRRTGEHSR